MPNMMRWALPSPSPKTIMTMPMPWQVQMKVKRQNNDSKRGDNIIGAQALST